VCVCVSVSLSLYLCLSLSLSLSLSLYLSLFLSFYPYFYMSFPTFLVPSLFHYSLISLFSLPSFLFSSLSFFVSLSVILSLCLHVFLSVSLPADVFQRYATPVEFEEEVSKCRKNRNTVCRCQSGFYKDVIDSDTSQCLRCSTCQPGSRQSEKCELNVSPECVMSSLQITFYSVREHKHHPLCFE